MKKKLIFQTSPLHTGSTFLVNALHGLIPQLYDKKVYCINAEDVDMYKDNFDDIILFKIHNLNIDTIIQKYQHNYDLFFICSERKEKGYLIDEKYKKYKNVVVFEYNELNETKENTIPNIIKNMYNKLINVLGIFLIEEYAVQRIINMNAIYEKLKINLFLI